MIRYLLCPSVTPGGGGGHLVRMLRLANRLNDAAVFIPEDVDPSVLDLLATYDIRRVSSVTNHQWVIIDKPYISSQELASLRLAAPVIAIDLGGSQRNDADYLIDTLPYPGHRFHRKHFGIQLSGMAASLGLEGEEKGGSPNLYHPGLIHVPGEQRSPDDSLQRILISFGASDPGKLTESVLKAISINNNAIVRGENETVSIEVVVPPLRKADFSDSEPPEGCCFVEFSPELPKQYSTYDLVITAYGLAAWEAQFSGSKVLVIDASNYHRELARISGFISVGAEHIQATLSELSNVNFIHQLVQQAQRVFSLERKELSQVIENLVLPKSTLCPCCGSAKRDEAARSTGRSYFLCSECGTHYLERFSPDTIVYSAAYFFDQYQAQYGKTYLEDFHHIKQMGFKRLKHIARHRMDQGNQPRLLDIGCAFGPFLSAASESGYTVEGIDISEDAVAHVTGELGFSARTGDISDPDFQKTYSPASYDVITMWYVIEHFPDLRPILSWISSLLKPWGVFAVATPSIHGISGRLNPQGFLLNGPEDHYTIWNPRQANRIAPEYGMVLQQWYSTGHHGERFPSVFGSPLLAPVSTLFSHMVSLGDGMECVFIKADDDARGSNA